MLAKLSVVGLYNYNNSIFDDMQTPVGIDRAALLDMILDEAGELACRYPDVGMFKRVVASWSITRLFTWNKIAALQSLEYNPIDNYDRTETETITREDSKTATQTGTVGDVYNGSGSSTDTGTTQHAPGITDTESATAFNSNTFQDTRRLTRGGSDTDTRNLAASYQDTSANTRTYNTKGEDEGESSETRQTRARGNIGVTTTQQMMMQEMELAKNLDLYKMIVDDFIDKFCVGVY